MTNILTSVGAVDVLVQYANTVLVRQGRDLPREYQPTPFEVAGVRSEIDARQQLNAGRGICVDGVHTHYRHDGAHWVPSRGYSTVRRAGGGDTPPGATAKVLEAIGHALDQSITLEMRDDAQRGAMLAKAAELRETARAMTEVVDGLNRQASELEADPEGARWEYLTQRLRSGSEQRAQGVRTRTGELVLVDEPRATASIPEGNRHLVRYRDEPADWTSEYA